MGKAWESHWWGPRLWKKLGTTLDGWILSVLEKLREIILVMEGQVTALLVELTLRVADHSQTCGNWDSKSKLSFAYLSC